MPGLTSKTNRVWSYFSFVVWGSSVKYKALNTGFEYQHQLQPFGDFKVQTWGFVLGSQEKVKIDFKNHLFLIQSTVYSTNLS